MHPWYERNYAAANPNYHTIYCEFNTNCYRNVEYLYIRKEAGLYRCIAKL